MADRIASWGYVVLVPHLFHRYGSAAEWAPTEDLLLLEARTALPIRDAAGTDPHARRGTS